MRSLLRLVLRLLLQIALLMLVYWISRCVLFALNTALFPGLTVPAFLGLCGHAVRYDLSAIFALNLLCFLLLFIHVPKPRQALRERALNLLFLVINITALAFEVSDWAYFPFSGRRSNAEVLKMVGRKADFVNLLPGYLVQFWYVLPSLILLSLLLVFANRRILRATAFRPPKKAWSARVLLILLVAAGGLVAIRGGLQPIPIGPRNAVQVAPARWSPLVLNTPFSILTTLQGEDLQPYHLVPDSIAARTPRIHRYPGSSKPPVNVVVIILESFSKEFTMLGQTPSYTPFLDSLMTQSLLCTQAYANGLHSAEGVPAVLSGIPSLMEEPFPTSNYGTNAITSLATELGSKGYSTAFFHGGTNGTMSFDVFCASAGFKQYFGRKEYNNERDYDGSWGIWDEPFLQYTAAAIGRLKAPFLASVFTLTSHPPYKIPPEYEGRFLPGPLPIHRCVRYSDLALRRFFETASRQPWFRNTVFVITPDHCSPIAELPYYKQGMGLYAIPILYYAPGDPALKGIFSGLTQQIDIMPSLLQYLHYDKPFYAMGCSIFDSTAHRFTVNELNQGYNWVSDGTWLRYEDVTLRRAVAFPADSDGRQPLPLNSAQLPADSRFRAFIQQYGNDLIHDRMRADQVSP